MAAWPIIGNQSNLDKRQPVCLSSVCRSRTRAPRRPPEAPVAMGRTHASGHASGGRGALCRRSALRPNRPPHRWPSRLAAAAARRGADCHPGRLGHADWVRGRAFRYEWSALSAELADPGAEPSGIRRLASHRAGAAKPRQAAARCDDGYCCRNSCSSMMSPRFHFMRQGAAMDQEIRGSGARSPADRASSVAMRFMLRSSLAIHSSFQPSMPAATQAAPRRQAARA